MTDILVIITGGRQGTYNASAATTSRGLGDKEKCCSGFLTTMPSSEISLLNCLDPARCWILSSSNNTPRYLYSVRTRRSISGVIW